MYLDSEEELNKHLNACQGYLQLDMPDEAMEELDAIASCFRENSDYLQFKAWTLMKKKDWKSALKYTSKLCSQYPELPVPFLDAAYCMHEMNNTQKARATLLNGPEDLRDYPTFHYNLACYNATLGDIDDARKHLNIAIKMDPSYRKQAENDPDLKMLHYMK